MGNEDLVSFVESLSGESHLRVQDDLGDGFVRLRAAEAQRRQAKQDIRSVEDVVLELVRNARDAYCHSVFVASWREGDIRRITVLDDGCGIPQTHQDQVFEPFVTSKLDTFRSDRWGVHGRGMALYSIRENVVDAHIACSGVGLGSSFAIAADTTVLPEKRDQSSFPKIVKDEDGSSLLRGPHNIARTVLEFAIDERQRIAVYLGSPTEIAATLFALGSQAVSRTSAVFDEADNDVPLTLRLAHCLDPVSFATETANLGLPMSERSARRIIDNDIKALPTVLELFVQVGKDGKRQPKKGQKTCKDGDIVAGCGQNDTELSESGFGPCDGVGPACAHQNDSTVVTERAHVKLNLTESDKGSLSSAAKAAFCDIADSYYLEGDVEPRVAFRNGQILIAIPVIAKD